MGDGQSLERWAYRHRRGHTWQRNHAVRNMVDAGADNWHVQTTVPEQLWFGSLTSQ